VALDVSFLQQVELDARRVGLEFYQDVCIDNGGAHFNGGGHVRVDMDGAAYDESFTIAFWLLKAKVDVWVPEDNTRGRRELLYSQLPINSDIKMRSHFFVEIFLTRTAWLGSWTLTVDLSGNNVHHFDVSLFQDSVPRWTHVSIIVAHGGVVSAYIDNEKVYSRRQHAFNVPEPVPRATFSNFKFNLDPANDHTGIREGSSESWLQDANSVVQVGELNLYGINGLALVGAVVTNTEDGDGVRLTLDDVGLNNWWTRPMIEEVLECSGGIYPCNQGPENAMDGTFAKWLDFTKGDLVITFGSPVSISSYDWMTGGDVPRRDPIKWQLEGSNDGLSWVVIDDVWAIEPFEPSTDRNTWQGPFQISSAVDSATSIGSVRSLRGVGLQPYVSVGGDNSMLSELHGSMTMLQVYDSALDASLLRCVHEGGVKLVQTGGMAQAAASECRGPIRTGCTSPVADGALEWLDARDTTIVDDGSCRFDENSAAGERGSIHVTDEWQRILLHGSYIRPVVICGGLSRQSTAQAVIRLGNVNMEAGGTWSFTIFVEQKSCHFASPPPISELVSYLVVEGGLSSDGWQAGLLRAYDREWNRVSFLRPYGNVLREGFRTPVVLSQVQNFESRTNFITTRHHFMPQPLQSAEQKTQFAFFVQVQGSGIWCPDGSYFTEYFDNLELSGNPIKTQCESTRPDWHWHICCDGVPPAMSGEDVSEPEIFSARWTTRIYAHADETFLFSSFASGSTKIVLDGDLTVLDAWGQWGTQVVSDAVRVSNGHHYLAYEFRSAESQNDIPTDSYAVLSWTTQGASGYSGDSNNVTQASADRMYADIGWLAVSQGLGTIQSNQFEAGLSVTGHNFLTSVEFSTHFVTSPSLFAAMVSTNSRNGHYRLTELDMSHASIATEYDTCNIMVKEVGELVSWVALANVGTTLPVGIKQQPTQASDIASLLDISGALALPDYLNWRNQSDPCGARWAGIECRRAPDGTPRVIVVDVSIITWSERRLT
jgi:hypothetical protein